jgi:hypothetical protein
MRNDYCSIATPFGSAVGKAPHKIDSLRHSELVAGDGPRFREHTSRLGLEGAISKRADQPMCPATMESGLNPSASIARSSSWSAGPIRSESPTLVLTINGGTVDGLLSETSSGNPTSTVKGSAANGQISLSFAGRDLTTSLVKLPVRLAVTAFEFPSSPSRQRPAITCLT